MTDFSMTAAEYTYQMKTDLFKGMFLCDSGVCQMMTDFHCERRCKDIACDKNVIVQVIQQLSGKLNIHHKL